MKKQFTHFTWTIIVLLLLVACGSNEATVPTPTAVAPLEPEPTIITATPVLPTATAIPPAETTAVEEIVEEEVAAEPTAVLPTEAPSPPSDTAVGLGGVITSTVVITASDGLQLHATYYAPVHSALRPAVILLHMLGGNRTAWEPTGLPQQLAHESRYHVLALDMRGHGETGGSNAWALAEEDLQLVWDWLANQPGVNGEATAVVGASIGSNMALRTGANIEAINTVVLLSPGLDYRGVTTEDALERYGQRPLLIVASEEDAYAAESSTTLAAQAQGETEFKLYKNAGHGTNMFRAEPDLTMLIADWLATYLP